MTEQPDIFAEQQLDKSADIRLFKQMVPFLSPYRWLLALSLVLILGVTLLELAIPYVTKEAIDRYIVPESSAEQVGRAAQDTPRHLTVDMEDPDVAAVVNRHPDLFKTDPPRAEIAFKALQQLSDKEVTRLRQDDIRGVTIAGLVLFCIVGLNFFINFAQVMVMEYTGQRIMHDLRLRLFSHIQALSLTFFNKNPVGRLVTRVTNDIQNMHEMLTAVVIFMLKDLFLVVGITVVLFSIDWQLAAAAYGIFPLVFYAAFKFAGSAREAYRTLRIKVAEINSKFSETIGGIHILQLFGQEKNNERAFRKINHENFSAGMRQVTVFALFMPFIEMMSAIALAIVIFYGGGRIIAGRVSLGELVVFISYLRMFFRPIRDIAEKYNITQNAMSSAERIFLILNEDDRLPEPAPGRALPAPARITELRFENVWFSYIPDEPVIKGVDFSVPAGRTVAVVGPTGAGKTSLINLIIRYYDPNAGTVRINGADIRRFQSRDLRQKMALVSQDPFLFSGPIRHNIFSGGHDPDDATIERILDQSRCGEIIRRLPEGIDTELNERGTTLSSGQRQLISIARALARDPELIIFDEATSYIDSETEASIQDAMANLMADRTAILIAHRLSTARVADRILVMHHGQIIETGTHEELMARGGFYWRLVQVQN